MHWPQYDPEDHEVLMQIVGLNGGAMYDHLTPMEKEWSEYLNVPFSKNHNKRHGPR